MFCTSALKQVWCSKPPAKDPDLSSYWTTDIADPLDFTSMVNEYSGFGIGPDGPLKYLTDTFSVGDDLTRILLTALLPWRYV